MDQNNNTGIGLPFAGVNLSDASPIIRENRITAKGARFVIHIPKGRTRIKPGEKS